MKIIKILIYSLILLVLLGCSNSKQISLTINSFPTGANVKETSLGEVGVTNLQKKIDIQNTKYLSFEVTKNGYKNARVTVNTELLSDTKHSNLLNLKTLFSNESDLTLELFLEKYPNRLTVFSRPSNVDLKITCGSVTYDFIQSIDTLLIIGDKEELECTLEAFSEGYEPLKIPIKILKNKENSINIILKRKKINISFNSEPQGAAIYEKSLGYICTTPCEYTIDGKKMDSIAPNRYAIKSSKASLQFEIIKDGYVKQSKSLLLETSKLYTLDTKLTKEN